MSGRLLVTGFGPFPGMPVNPAGALARRVAAHPRLRLALAPAPRALVLTTAYGAIPAELAPALAERPAAVLMLGVASRALRLRVEARARNRGGALQPDAAGRRGAGVRLDLDPLGPAARVSPHAAPALSTLRRRGLAVRPSNDAGQYLCNASYYRALAQRCPVLFVHVPPAARVRRPRRAGALGGRVAPGRQADALAEVALALVVRGRRAEFRGPSGHKPALARSWGGGRHAPAPSGPDRRV